MPVLKQPLRSKSLDRVIDIVEMAFRSNPPEGREYEEITDPTEIKKWREIFDREVTKAKAALADFDSFCQRFLESSLIVIPTREEVKEYCALMEASQFVPGLAERLFKVKVV